MKHCPTSRPLGAQCPQNPRPLALGGEGQGEGLSNLPYPLRAK